MPRNTREWAHRKLVQAKTNIDWAGAHIQAVKELYEKDQKVLADGMDSIQQLLLMADDLIDILKRSF